jgi:hypothetical protein
VLLLGILVRYIGPESAGSTVSTVPKLAAGSDFLVKIEEVSTVE